MAYKGKLSIYIYLNNSIKMSTVTNIVYRFNEISNKTV